MPPEAVGAYNSDSGIPEAWIEYANNFPNSVIFKSKIRPLSLNGSQNVVKSTVKSLKYTAAYSIPIVAIFSIQLGGFWLFATPVYAFLLIPVLELIMPEDPSNLKNTSPGSRPLSRVYDWMLYLNLPLVYGILIYALIKVSAGAFSGYEYAGLIFSVGIVLGVNGINVGHELGHRKTVLERLMGKALLLPSLYSHFYTEHNYGHHLNVATPQDPATARYGQNVYHFWLTSISRQYTNAWRIQRKLLARENASFFSISNHMFYSSLLQLWYLGAIFMIFGSQALFIALGMAVVGALLLETVNYIEHYGLLRNRTSSGRYERVAARHSWNSNHVVGRIVLYELTRHSDHHFKSAKKYQLLDYQQDAPSMPFGYPTSMVLALIPPLWFRVMNSRIPPNMLPV
jgi:alkane 1-monooxygenase